MEIKLQLSKIGQELETLTAKVSRTWAIRQSRCPQGSVDDMEQFLEMHSKVLHPNHYHMTTCKHNLMQVSRLLWKVLNH